jgi:Leucine-rich repeat (LRR) protein
LPNLEELNISGNRLRTVDFNRCKKLQDIDLSGNEVKDLSGLKGMACLQILNVSKNFFFTLQHIKFIKYISPQGGNLIHNFLVLN